MSHRTLVWVPLVVAAIFLGVELAMGPSMQAGIVLVEVELAKVLWLAGALATASVFERGDYLRRGWLLIAGAAAAFLSRDASHIPFVRTAIGTTGVGVWAAVTVVAGNASQVAGVWLLARFWSAVGFDDAVRGRRGVLFAAAIVLSVLLTGPSLVHDAAGVASGSLDAVPHLASDLGDAIDFVLLAALVRSALALRGGVVFWPWSLFAAGEVAWMLFDGARTLTELFGNSWASTPLTECLRVVGALYFCSAGVAQRWVVSSRFPAGVGAGWESSGELADE
jgi:hypothetical protein